MYSAEVITRQDQLLGEIIGLARASEGNEDLVSDQKDQALLSGLVLAGSDDIEELQQQIQKIQEEKRKIVPDCFECAAPCGRTAAYDITLLLPSTSRIDMLKIALIFCIRAIAAELQPPEGHIQEESRRFLYSTLVLIGLEPEDPATLIDALETGSRLYARQRMF